MKRILFILLLTLAVPCYGQRFVKSVPNLTALLQQNPADIQSNIWTMGYSAPWDGGQGHWHPTNSVGVITNRGTLIMSPVNTNYVWVREYFGELNVQWFGAKGYGAVDDGPAMQDAINSATTGQTVYFPSPNVAYYCDRTLIVTNQIVLRGENSRIRLFSFSTLFNSAGQSNLVEIDASNVTMKGLYLDGNSQNNYFVSGGKSHYYDSPGYQVYLCNIGRTAAVTNIVIDSCTFDNSPFVGLAAGWYGVGQCADITVNNCYFNKCQGVQLTSTHTTRLTVSNCRFIQPYFYNFQPYDAVTNVLYNNNYDFFQSSTLNTNVIELYVLGGSSPYGTTQIGKYNDTPAWTPVDQVTMVGNTWNGAMLALANTAGNVSVKDNVSTYSEYAGFYLAATNGSVIVSGNTITGAKGPGIATAPHTNILQITGNTLIGNHTSTDDHFFGGHLTAANLYFSNDGGVSSTPTVYARNNVIKMSGGFPKYGVNLDPTVQGSLIYYEGNQDYQGGNTADILDTGGNFWNGWRSIGATVPFRIIGSSANMDINDMTGSNPFWSLSRSNVPYWYFLDDAADDSFFMSGRTVNGVEALRIKQTGIKNMIYDLGAGADPGATYSVDFKVGWQQITPTANITLSSANLAKGREVTLFIFPTVGAATYTITYPVGWTIAGLWGTTTVFANRAMILKLYSRSNNDASVNGSLSLYTTATDFEKYQNKQTTINSVVASGTNVLVDCNYAFGLVNLNNTSGYLISAQNNGPGLKSELLLVNITGSNIPLYYDAGWGTPLCPLDAAGGNSCTNLGPNRRAILKIWNLNSSQSGVTAEYTHQN